MLYASQGRPVLIAVPAYGGLSAGTAYSLFRSRADAELAILPGRCHVDDARNELVATFLASKASDLVFIDADVEFHPDHLERLLKHDADVVAGVYPKRAGGVAFPVELPPGDLFAKNDLLEVLGVPAGFLRIRRRVLEQLAASAPRHPVEGQSVPIIFERTLEEGTRWGGDYSFCRKARKAGFKVFADPEIWLKHGTREGSLGAFLRKKHMLGMGHALARLRRKSQREIIEACQELHEYWCNPWACTASTLVALALLAKGKRTILECGSGISTLVMAAAEPNAEIHVLEDQTEWASRLCDELARYGLGTNVHLHMSMRDETTAWWYEPPKTLPDFDLVFVDGPTFHSAQHGVVTSTRLGVYSKLADRIAGAVMVVDDAGEYSEILREWQHTVVEGRVAICLPKERRIAA